VIIGRSDNMEAVSREFVTQAHRHRRRSPPGIARPSLAIATAATPARPALAMLLLFVDLAPIEDPSLVISTLASTLGLSLRADDPVTAVVDFLRDERVLIVLDNCEQVIEVVAGLAHRILRETVETHLLITSREPLRIAGEHVHRLAPLECPPVKGRHHRRGGQSLCRRPVVR